MVHSFRLTTDHFQFLAGDRHQASAADTTALWDSPGTVKSMLSVPELVGVGTVRYGGITTVAVEVLPIRPNVVPPWVMLGEFTLSLPSGQLMLWAPETEDLHSTPLVSLTPGRYTGFALGKALDRVTDEMANDGPEEYRLVLWIDYLAKQENCPASVEM